MTIPRRGMHGLNALSVRTIPEGFILADSGELIKVEQPGPGIGTYALAALAGWWLWKKYKKGKATEAA